MSNTYYITTAIDYVNGNPHIGHAYEKVLTDALARYQRFRGRKTFFLTGTDEHGQKVQQTAVKNGKDPQQFCDEMSGRFLALYKQLNISFDDFVRTTEARHKEVVQEILTKLYDAGEIYGGEYEGYYSARVEQFLAEKEMVDGKFPEEYGEVVRLKEKVWFFRMEKHQNWLREYIQKNPDFIFPSFRAKEVLGALEKPIGDLCISRPKNRLAWGIPLPFDEDQVTYVWFDALINYVSIVGYGTDKFKEYWPAIHVIGKDILVPAHSIYWTIMLHALGVEMPRQIIAHGWWTQNKEKMSKSVGNVVNPLSLIEIYGVDAFRYFVLREMVVGQDADFSQQQFHQRYQSDLGNDLGNLVNRVVSMIRRYRQGKIPSCASIEKELEAKITDVIAESRQHMDFLQIHNALRTLWTGFQRANQYVEESAPWKLAKDGSPSAQAQLDSVLNQLASAVAALAYELTPILPDTAQKIFEQLGCLSLSENNFAAWSKKLSALTVGEPTPLFPRIELPSA